jgi:hypothetical protein
MRLIAPGTFRQPCSALEGCRCLIYSQRPVHCRQFECLLLKELQSGKVKEAAALRIIRQAREKLRKVQDLLRALGNQEEHLAVRARCKRVEESMKRRRPSKEHADTYGQLTLAIHDLNLIISERFYP